MQLLAKFKKDYVHVVESHLKFLKISPQHVNDNHRAKT